MMKLRLKYGFKMLFRKICMNYFFSLTCCT